MKLFVDYDDTIMKSSIQALKYLRKLGLKPNICAETSSINYNTLDLVQSDVILPWSYSKWFKDCDTDIVQSMLIDKDYLLATQPMDDACDVLRRLSYRFDIYIVTVGKTKNLQVKMDIIDDVFPFVKGIIASTEFDKSLINMEDSIFIDDRSDFLGHSNANNKILFKYKNVERETNQHWTGPVIYSWKEAEAMIRNSYFYKPHYTGEYRGRYSVV